MRLREKILNRIVTIIWIVVRLTVTWAYNWFPGFPKFLDKYFPQLKFRLSQVTRTEYRTSDERRRNDEIITLFTKYSYQQIIELIFKEEASEVFSYLRGCGFKQSVESFDFKIVPSELKVSLKSLVEIERADNGNVQIRIDFFRVRNSQLLLERLVIFLIGYWNGVEKILDHELNQRGQMRFYLCLEDSYEISSKQESNSSFYAFSRPKESIDVGLVPDPYALAELNSTQIFSEIGSLEKARADFLDRKKKIFWRGSTTGHIKGVEIKNNQRIVFCKRLLEYPDLFDVRITSVVQQFNTKSGRKKIEESGVMGDIVSESEFAEYMATLDLEGNASPWGTLRKYLKHIHIMKPEGKFSHFFDYFQEEGSHTPFTNLDDLLERLQSGEIIIDDFDVAHRGYHSALNALALMANGDATVYPIYSKQ
jgi:hypothetical protein